MKEIIILGAGYGGLKALHYLQKAKEDIHITIVDKNDYHCEIISLAEVASGSIPKEKIMFPIKDIVKKDRTNFIQDEVTKIDSDNNKVYLKSKGELEYDYLIVALGFHSESFGIDGVDQYALSMDSIPTALKIKNHIEDEMKAYRKDKDENHLKIVVCGAGFTGVELLGSLKDMKETYAELAGVSKEQIQLICVDHSSVFLPMFNRNLADYGMKWLIKWGIEFHLECGINQITKNGLVYVDKEEKKHQLEAGTVIWTTGVSGSDVMRESGYEERRGRVRVNQDMSSPNHQNVFIVGDVSAFFVEGEKRPYPTTAQIALQMGHCAAHNIIHLIKGEKTIPFVYHNRGTVASIGNSKSFGVGLGLPVKGYIGSVTKKMIDNLSLYETGGIKELMSKGKFDFYH